MANLAHTRRLLHVRRIAPVAAGLFMALLGGCSGDGGGAGGAAGTSARESTAIQSTGEERSCRSEPSDDDEQTEGVESRASTKSGVQWWQWAFSLPATNNPTLDTKGDFCMLGQHGSVFYLSGFTFPALPNTPPPPPVTRTCQVPEGVDLFFPIANTLFNDTPGACGQEFVCAALMQPLSCSLSIPFLRSIVTSIVDGLTNVSATFDGRPIHDVRRSRGPIFSIDIPADNLGVAPGFSACPAGVITSNVQDGLYATVHSVAPGNHTLHFHADSPTSVPAGIVFPFTQDVTYQLTVVPKFHQ
jgi:hypothetical protein